MKRKKKLTQHNKLKWQTQEKDRRWRQKQDHHEPIGSLFLENKENYKFHRNKQYFKRTGQLILVHAYMVSYNKEEHFYEQEWLKRVHLRYQKDIN